MSNPVADLRNQRATRARRDRAARHAGDAAMRYIDAHRRYSNRADVLAPALAELEGAADEYELAAHAYPPGAHYTLRLGRLIVTMGNQGPDAPWLDDASLRTTVVDDDGNRELLIGNGYALRLGSSGRAIVAGVVDWTPPSLRWSTTWRRMHRRRARLVDWPHAGDDSAGMSPGTVGDYARMAAGGPRPIP